MDTTIHQLPSGAELKITLSDFSISKSLYQAMAEEMGAVEAKTEMDLIKNLVFTGLASKKIEAGIWECMKRVTYNGLKVTPQTFEPKEARQDYLAVCFEVAWANVSPFMKGLFVLFDRILKEIESIRAQKSEKTI